MSPRRCVIVGGAAIDDYACVKVGLKPDDFFIYCDSGLRHLSALGVPPDLVVGDFDSHEPPQLMVETIRLPREKDDTDTMFAAREAVRRGVLEVLLLGVVGRRLDHSLGNVSILFWLAHQGVRGEIWDDYSRMEVVEREATVDPRYPYFSLLNLTGTARGVTIEGAKFPLCRAELPCDYAYGVSNEPLPGVSAKITLEMGELLLIKVLRP